MKKNKKKDKNNKAKKANTWSYQKTVPAKTTPKDTVASDKLAIVFFDQAVLNGMRDKCIDTAKDNEWQIHHADLRVELQRGGITVSMFFPMAFYNFKQEVGPSSVDWETEDADTAFNESKDTAKENAQKFIAEMPIFKAFEKAGLDVVYDFGDFGSIHRHPGRFGFSSIDLRKNPDNPGVIYRRAEAENLWQVDSVMYMDEGKDGDVEIYTTECRILNIKEAGDGGVEGTYCKIPTVTIIRDEKKYGTENKDGLFQIFGELEPSVFDEYTIVGKIDKYPILGTILTMFKDAEYLCETSGVVEDNIEPKVFSRYKGGQWHGGYGSNSYYGGDYGYGYTYGYNSDVARPKSYTSKGVIEEIIELYPGVMSKAEEEHIKDMLDRLSYIETRELFSVAHDVLETWIDIYKIDGDVEYNSIEKANDYPRPALPLYDTTDPDYWYDYLEEGKPF